MDNTVNTKLIKFSLIALTVSVALFCGSGLGSGHRQTKLNSVPNKEGRKKNSVRLAILRHSTSDIINNRGETGGG